MEASEHLPEKEHKYCKGQRLKPSQIYRGKSDTIKENQDREVTQKLGKRISRRYQEIGGKGVKLSKKALSFISNKFLVCFVKL